MATRRKILQVEEPAPKRRGSRAPVKAEEGHGASDYFTGDKDGITFVSSGCTLIDCALGGGYAMRRVVNLVGDKSSGKTLLAIEACPNFLKVFPKDGYIRYAEAEAAFDKPYAEALGLDLARVEFTRDKRELRTVEDWYTDMLEMLDTHKDRPCLYILDSLDALSDKAEQEREITDNSYGGSKPKKLGELFRRLVQRIEEQNCLLIVISQLRDKLNVTFGEKQVRSGGRALDFYSSHIIWIAEIGKIKKTVEKIDRVVGMNVKLRVKKNKVGLAFREAEYPVVFGYGVDDLTASVEWLISAGRADRLAEVEMSQAGYKVRINNLRNKGGEEAQATRAKLNEIVKAEWKAIEQKFLPQSRKYG